MSLFLNSAFSGPEDPNHPHLKNKHLLEFPVALMIESLYYLDRSSIIKAACSSYVLGQTAKRLASDGLMNLLEPFVKIPAERSAQETGQPLLISQEIQSPPMASFELRPFPVTRALWMKVMRKAPSGVKSSELESWMSCSECPVTHFTFWKQDRSQSELNQFLILLNGRTASTGCVYDLPNWDQFEYATRGDVTGRNRDKYSSGVTKENVDLYVIHSGNSQGQIQPVNRKDEHGQSVMKKNSFGIELGNVRQLVRGYLPNAQSGRTYGCSWKDDISKVGLGHQTSRVERSEYSDDVGFSLVRKCK